MQGGTEASQAFHLSLSPTPPPPQAPEAQRATFKSSSTPPINVLGNRFSEFYISLRMSSQRSGLQLFKAGTSSLTSRLSTTARSESWWVSVCVCVWWEQGRLFIPPRTTARSHDAARHRSWSNRRRQGCDQEHVCSTPFLCCL